MKAKIIITSVVALLFFLTGYSQNDDNYKKQWKRVEKYQKQGLPKSAINVVDEIYILAKKDNNTPQFLKALLNKVALNSKFEIDYNEKALKLLENEIASADNSIQKSILHSVTAQLYNNYYKNNRYKISKRSCIENYGDDIRTWDISKILQTARNHYKKSILNTEILANKNIEEYYSIIKKGKDTYHLRPTLFDFLAFRALNFYNSNDFLLTEANLEINFSDVKLFCGYKDFINISFPDESKYSSLKVFQQLLKTHKKNYSALVDVDLARLNYVKQNFTETNKEELYISALKKLSDNVKKTPEWANVQYAIANQYFYSTSDNEKNKKDNKWNNKIALEYCNNAIKKYPESYGASHAQTLKIKILKKSLNIEMSRENLPEENFDIEVAYKNLDKLYFRIIKTSQESDWRNVKDKKEKLNVVLQKHPVKEWNIEIKNEGDYRIHTTEITVSELDKGNYILLAATSPNFSIDNEYVSFSEFWVTDITYFSNQLDGKLDIYVVERESGNKIKNADVKCFCRKYNYKTRSYKTEIIDNFKTNSQGKITLSDKNISNKTFYIDITDGKDRFVSDKSFYVRRNYKRNKSELNTYFFTDRSIYRPGQVVYFKGLVLKKENKKSFIEKNYKTTVKLMDVNNQLISKSDFVINEFGSFSGSFILPDETLSGNFKIVSETGRCSFSVEEYKRPKFSIEMLPVTESFKVNENITVKGKTIALAGYPLDGAKVSYIVKRDVQNISPYYGRYIPYPSTLSVVIKSGETKTDKEGIFSIDFVAKPDLGRDKSTHPKFK
ncbi:MAG: MG2 domain-containing protein, partial [Bacteroidota bacterium]|nr:MG2 domain-containing protein [Bacteroidota bacterium]